MPAIDETKLNDHADVKALMVAMLADITAIRSALVATHAKLDADAGVTDTDYASANDPAALTVTAS